MLLPSRNYFTGFADLGYLILNLRSLEDWELDSLGEKMTQVVPSAEISLRPRDTPTSGAERPDSLKRAPSSLSDLQPAGAPHPAGQGNGAPVPFQNPGRGQRGRE